MSSFYNIQERNTKKIREIEQQIDTLIWFKPPIYCLHVSTLIYQTTEYIVPLIYEIGFVRNLISVGSCPQISKLEEQIILS